MEQQKLKYFFPSAITLSPYYNLIDTCEVGRQKGFFMKHNYIPRAVKIAVTLWLSFKKYILKMI